MQRRRITVAGVVQGVGFRPYVHRLANKWQLHGMVSNQGGAVVIDIEGSVFALDEFAAELTRRTPPLARIESISCVLLPPRGAVGFRIDASQSAPDSSIRIAADVPTCSDCLAELFDPANRRYRYPFINCTNCGPRLTIANGVPYDRARTTMSAFAMCSECRAEYDDPCDRRFHAQPIACPSCGPQLAFIDTADPVGDESDPLTAFAAAIGDGRIGAIKGLGGYHLVCDARRGEAVGELRRRKHRDEKPFAVMVRDLAAATRLCELGPLEKELLASARGPIVLLRKRRGTEGAAIAPLVAPGNPLLGVMLPYTPLHHLLLAAVGDVPLVVTSGNCSDEPIAYQDKEALQRLAKVGDVFLTHDRPIHVRCEDSVTRVVAGAELPVRRSRGDVPQPLRLPITCPVPVLAVGGQLKTTFCLTHREQAILSHHLGDLDHLAAAVAFRRDVALFQELFSIEPAYIAHDLHPDYASTRWAHDLELPSLAVQHHHAHMAACMAENNLTRPVIAVTFDGAGLGTDGHIWGGEFLVGDYASFRRAAHVRYVGMPGGDRAVREPWRMAVAHLRDAGCESAALEGAIPRHALHTVCAMLEQRFHTPLTSSVGRLFDAVAAMIGLRTHAGYEGQAAIQLEWAAETVQRDSAYPFEVLEEASEAGSEVTASALPGTIVDTRPLIRAIAGEVRCGVDARIIARRFHTTLMAIVVEVCQKIRRWTAIDTVVLSGGVFANALLTVEVTEHLRVNGFQVFRHCRVPPNDGGLSLGQAVVAAQYLALKLEAKTPEPCVWEFPAGSSRRTANTTC